MSKVTGRFKFSGRIADDDLAHRVQEIADAIIAPQYIYIPGIGYVPQYASTVIGVSVGYHPAQDCKGYFMPYKFQSNNNSYNYSCNIASNSCAQPGRAHGYAIPQPPTGPNVRAGAERDGLIFVGTQVSDLKKHAALDQSGHYVALLISQADTHSGWPGDYHWVRCDDVMTCQSWSQKNGYDQVTNFDFAGHPITDPATANWTVNQGPMCRQNSGDLVVSYSFYGYMFVPSGQVSII